MTPNSPLVYAVVASVVTAGLTVTMLSMQGAGEGEFHRVESAALRKEAQMLRNDFDNLRRAVGPAGAARASRENPIVAAAAGADDPALPPVLRLFGKAPQNRPSAVKRVPKANEGRYGGGPDEFYDGRTDAKHLGGSTGKDTAGITPGLWNFVLKALNVRSVVDVGCGRGISTKWFLDHGADVLCLEGANDAINKSYLPRQRIVAHDFSLGPYWPDKTYDMAWCIEVLEHISRPYMANYQAIFHKSAIVVASHSAWGGHHHVEVHPDWWWQTRMELTGLQYSDVLTRLFRTVAGKFRKPQTSEAQHIIFTTHVYINPKVAGLPQHAHLMGMFGCFASWPSKADNKLRQNGPCPDKEDALPEQFLPVHRTPTQWDIFDLNWDYGQGIGGKAGGQAGTTEFDLSLTNRKDAECLKQTWPQPTADDGCAHVGKTFNPRWLVENDGGK